MNTIYDNTFVLGETSATNFIAGPGIKIDEPSAGTVRIGNDETVLWSGTPITMANASNGVTLTESPFNFERVALYWVPWNYDQLPGNDNVQNAVAIAGITNQLTRIGAVTEWNAENNNTMFIFILNGYFTSAKFYSQCVKYFQIGSWSVSTNMNYSMLTKIVGINRISGGNE